MVEFLAIGAHAVRRTEIRPGMRVLVVGSGPIGLGVAYFARIAPESAHYEHDDEGPDDMPAHLRAALTQTHLSIPVNGGKLALGTWQGIFLFEHRRNTPERQIALHLIGE